MLKYLQGHENKQKLRNCAIILKTHFLASQNTTLSSILIKLYICMLILFYKLKLLFSVGTYNIIEMRVFYKLFFYTIVCLRHTKRNDLFIENSFCFD